MRFAVALGETLLHRREDCLEGAAVMELLVEAEIACSNVADATVVANRLTTFGAGGTCAMVLAYAARAVGRVAAARVVAGGEATAREAVLSLERALSLFAELEMPLELARSRLLLARVIAEQNREAAIAECRVALAAFERLGAARDANAAAAFLRSLGCKAARSGPKGIGRLTKRELEVLELLAEGLSNQKLAKRLFVSPKTAEHHVRSLLSKLGLSNRAEAAAYAVRHLARGPASK